MIHHAKLPLQFWAEAVNTAVYFHNRSPTVALKDETPFECWFGRKPDIFNLRVFGFVWYMHVPDGQRRKLDPKSSKGIFIGYPEGTKGYKLYDLKKKKFFRSRNILFYEDKFYYPDSEGKSDDVSKIVFLEEGVDFESIIEHPIDIENLPEAQGDDIKPVGERNEDNPVKATYEETFIQQFRNIRTKRERKPPRSLIEDISNYVEHCFMTTSESDEPKSPSEALYGEHSDQWKEAMDSEYSSLLKNET